MYKYPVYDSGLYCVLAVPDDSESFQDFGVTMFVQNPYGSLPAIYFPALPFFATQLAAYLLIGLIWLVVSLINRRELLPIQNLVGATIFFLIVENSVNLGFFVDFNNHGFITKTFLGIMVTMNAARNSITFFMLLVVSLGYGVVYPSLGKKLYWCIALAVVHFIFGALYYTTSMLAKDVRLKTNNVGKLFCGLPLGTTSVCHPFYLLYFHSWR